MLDEVDHGQIDSEPRTDSPSVRASRERRAHAEALSAALATIDGFDDDEFDDDNEFRFVPEPTDEPMWMPGADLDGQYADDRDAQHAKEDRPARTSRRSTTHPSTAPDTYETPVVVDRTGGEAPWWSTGDDRDIERLADSLPFHAPAGYRRDGRGAWRYEGSSDRVPGARDRTLATSWRPIRKAPIVTMPRNRARASTDLQWMFDVEVAHHDPTVVAVTANIWDALARRPLGIVAPELSADRLWDVEQVAVYLGVSVGTVWSYRSRDKFPQPVALLGQNPVWSEPLVAAWDLSRPGQGARNDLGHKGRQRRSFRK